MCTVTYLPTSTGFVLTHNRDEAPARSPKHIDSAQVDADTLYFPRDSKAGGTWIAASRSGKLACVLNGAFLKHRHEPPYRRSRGLVLLDFFKFENPDDFWEQYPLEGIEPFTFLYFEAHRVVELRWDGVHRHLKMLAPDAPHFWCSATLYPPEMQVRREQVFRQWLGAAAPTEQWPKAALKLHQTGSVGDPENDYVMNRQERVRTVSITQVIFDGEQFRLKYKELLDHINRRRIIPLRSFQSAK